MDSLGVLAGISACAYVADLSAPRWSCCFTWVGRLRRCAFIRERAWRWRISSSLRPCCMFGRPFKRESYTAENTLPGLVSWCPLRCFRRWN